MRIALLAAILVAPTATAAGPVAKRYLRMTAPTETEPFDVMFNPKEYTIDPVKPWQQHGGHSKDCPELDFTAGEKMTLAMELVLDTSIRPAAKAEAEQIVALTKPGQKGRPLVKVDHGGTLYPVRLDHARVVETGKDPLVITTCVIAVVAD